MTEHGTPPSWFTEASVGDTLPEMVIDEVGVKDFVMYAGASGDFARMHYDTEFVREHGNSGPWGHGMLAGGYAAQYLTQHVGIQHIRTYSIRFESRYWPGDTLTIGAKIDEITRHESARDIGISLSVTDQSGTVILSGSARVTVPEE